MRWIVSWIDLFVNLEQQLIHGVLSQVELLDEALDSEAEVVALVDVEVFVPLEINFHAEGAEEPLSWLSNWCNTLITSWLRSRDRLCIESTRLNFLARIWHGCGASGFIPSGLRLDRRSCSRRRIRLQNWLRCWLFLYLGALRCLLARLRNWNPVVVLDVLAVLVVEETLSEGVSIRCQSVRLRLGRVLSWIISNINRLFPFIVDLWWCFIFTLIHATFIWWRCFYYVLLAALLAVGTCHLFIAPIISHIFKLFMNLRNLIIRNCIRARINEVFDSEGLLDKVFIVT